jgi:hypothetical protein
MPRASRTAAAENPALLMREAIRACREGSWWQGHNQLTRLAQLEERRGNMPGFFYGYLGQAMARCEGRKRDGLDLCLYAVSVEPFRPENHLNLAHVYFMLRNRRGTLRALETGLEIDPTHEGLLELQSELGLRRRPAIPFLARGNPLNQLAGRISQRASDAWARLRRDDEDDDLEDL